MTLLRGLLWMSLLWPWLAPAAPGSWSAEAPSVRVAVPGRIYHSEELLPPGDAASRGNYIQKVRWRYSTPPGRSLRAWLCQGERCLRLSGNRGISEALQGPAWAPLSFRFQLPDGERRAVTVTDIQVLVNY